MNVKDYKGFQNSPHVLSQGALEISLKEMLASDNLDIAIDIERILTRNKINKPPLHALPQDKTTDLYLVDLNPDIVERIVDIFGLLEATNVTEDGEATGMASFYASMVDVWNNMLER